MIKPHVYSRRISGDHAGLSRDTLFGHCLKLFLCLKKKFKWLIETAFCYVLMSGPQMRAFKVGPIFPGHIDFP